MRIFFFIFLIFAEASFGQFTEADSVRGQLRPERTCYDVKFYDLKLDVNFDNKSINGFNKIYFNVVRGFNMLQVDLFSNMQIDSILHGKNKLKYYRKHHAVFVDFGEMQEEDRIDSLTIYYHGTPIIAVNPPWDGGFSWNNDKNGKGWLGVSCEGIGASLWWPNKDHLSDEPDSMRMTFTVPGNLTCVSNGNLRKKTNLNDKSTFEWFVSYPINNYNVTLNVADYIHFSDTFISAVDKEKLPLDYYVLSYNRNKAVKQFSQSKEVIRIFEKYLGKYPFWRDGYALVETPYLGMEHQGAIAYGNQFLPGYMGRYPENMDEDYIILHETGHEWWGNSVSCNDHGEMWLHESFCTYMEAVYMEEKYGFESAIKYLKYQKDYIENNYPILGPLDVNFDSKDSDMYYKGTMMLHTLRVAIDNDVLWWDIIKSFHQNNAIKNVTSADFIQHVNKKTGSDYNYFFEQYLKSAQIPELQYKVKKNKGKYTVSYKWNTEVKEFKMPVYLKINNKKIKLEPDTKEYKKIEIDKFSQGINPGFKFGLFELIEDFNNVTNYIAW